VNNLTLIAVVVSLLLLVGGFLVWKATDNPVYLVAAILIALAALVLYLDSENKFSLKDILHTIDKPSSENTLWINEYRKRGMDIAVDKYRKPRNFSDGVTMAWNILRQELQSSGQTGLEGRMPDDMKLDVDKKYFLCRISKYSTTWHVLNLDPLMWTQTFTGPMTLEDAIRVMEAGKGKGQPEIRLSMLRNAAELAQTLPQATLEGGD